MPVVTGYAVSPGQARGPAFIHAPELQRIDPSGGRRGDQKREHTRIRAAMDDVQAGLETDACHMTGALGADSGDVFRAQSALAGDAAIGTALAGHVEDEMDAEKAVRVVFANLARRFRQSGVEVTRARGDDIDDLARRLLLSLRGIRTHRLESMPAGSVLVARHLYPSDTVFLSRRTTVAVVAEFAGPAAHAALLAREMGVPCVGGITGLLELVASGDELLVDGSDGTVVIRPDADQDLRFATLRSEDGAGLPEDPLLPVATRDGTSVQVLANARNRDDIDQAVRSGAAGIGLFRIEPYFLASKHMPTVDELSAFLASSMEPAGERRVNIRLLDIGGDKNLPYLPLPFESDPSLGLRGIRVLLRFPELLRAQLRAILGMAAHHNIGIIVPMVTVVEDVVRVREALDVMRTELGLATLPPIGAMVETPAAALMVPELLAHVDFLSIGSNDLTQYTMAAGRENGSVRDYFLECHPAMMRLMARAVADAGSTPVCLCGELAGRPGAMPALLACGLREFSVASSLLAQVRRSVRSSGERP